MPKTEIHTQIDALLSALRKRGFNAKRCDAIEILADISGCRNSHEMMAKHAAAPERQGNDNRKCECTQTLTSHLERLTKLRRIVATRDGATFETLIDHSDQVREQSLQRAAHHFGISDILSDNQAGDTPEERFDFLEGEMDSFHIETVHLALDPDEVIEAIQSASLLTFISSAARNLENSAILVDKS